MKPGTFTQIYIQVVFSPYKRECLIMDKYQEELYKYINGTIKNLGHKPIIINGMPDHIHILIGLNPKQSVSDLVRDIKRSSALFINEKKWFRGNFHWQEGYGCFSYGRSQLNDIYQYIKNQHSHHSKLTFKEEYIGFLKKFEVQFKEQYLFQFFN